MPKTAANDAVVSVYPTRYLIRGIPLDSLKVGEYWECYQSIILGKDGETLWSARRGGSDVSLTLCESGRLRSVGVYVDPPARFSSPLEAAQALAKAVEERTARNRAKAEEA